MSAYSADILPVFHGDYTILQPITARGKAWLERNFDDAWHIGGFT